MTQRYGKDEEERGNNKNGGEKMVKKIKRLLALGALPLALQGFVWGYEYGPSSVIDDRFVTHRTLQRLVDHIGKKGAPVRRGKTRLQRIDPIRLDVPRDLDPLRFGGSYARVTATVSLNEATDRPDLPTVRKTLEVRVSDRRGNSLVALVRADGPKRGRLVQGVLRGDIIELKPSPILQRRFPLGSDTTRILSDLVLTVVKTAIDRLPVRRIR